MTKAFQDIEQDISFICKSGPA